jgi:hypothetical protein
MEPRFRIRTREGDELRPRTTEIFAEFVRSGVVRPEDFVFDALTGEWSPAAVHPMVRLMKDPLVDGWEDFDPETAGVPPEGPALAPDGAEADLKGALDLVQEPGPSPEQEARDFIARME